MDGLPRVYSPYDLPMWESIASGEMKLQRCPQSGVFRYPPGPVCPVSLSFESEWCPISGHAKILSWTVFHKKYLSAYPPPTLIVVVQLSEGPMMVGNMDYEELSGVHLDASVRLIYGKHPDGYTIPRFTFVDAADV